MSAHIVSRHFFRRRARAAALRLNVAGSGHRFTVRASQRGPYRWYVIEN